jgi:hypothetical protein
MFSIGLGIQLLNYHYYASLLKITYGEPILNTGPNMITSSSSMSTLIKLMPLGYIKEWYHGHRNSKLI